MLGMNNEILEMPYLKNLGLLITYKCQVACPHCVIEAGPHRKEEMMLSDAFNWIKQISSYRSGYIKVLALTGGEPFYNINHLNAISSFAEKCDLFVSVVTNAFWASTQQEAIGIFKELPSIKMLSISTDVYHLASIPLKRIKNAIMAARECDIPYTIAICTEDENSRDYKEILNELNGINEEDTILTAITFRAGRALQKISSSKYRKIEEPPISACSAGCSPIVLPDGRVIACVGPVISLESPHPLVLGNLRENSLHEILDKAEKNPILHAIRIWGPRKLISIIKEAGLNKYLPKRYIKDCVCDACYNLMSNSNIVNFLTQLAEDYEFRRKVAYARVYYLNETKMAELLQLTASN